MNQLTLVRFSVEPFLEVKSYIFFNKYEITNALQVIDTVCYCNGTVPRWATKNKIACRTSLTMWIITATAVTYFTSFIIIVFAELLVGF